MIMAAVSRWGDILQMIGTLTVCYGVWKGAKLSTRAWTAVKAKLG